jgi:hypothetical protein
VPKPVPQRTFRISLNPYLLFLGPSIPAGAFSDETFNADVWAGVLIGQAQGEYHHMSCGGGSGAGLDRRLSVLKGVQPTGTRSDRDLNRIGTGLELR